MGCMNVGSVMDRQFMNVERLMNRHMEYAVSNCEWVRSNGYYTLSQFIQNELCIVGDGMSLYSYRGVGYYYVRNVYGLEYNSCSGRYVGSVDRGRAILDPWGRCFGVFPYQRRNGGNMIHGYDGYYSQVVNSVVYHDERKVDRDRIVDNVMVLVTSVSGVAVYCVDILAGEYDGV